MKGQYGMKRTMREIFIRIVATVVAALILVAVGKWLGIAALGGVAVRKMTKQS